MILPRRSLLVGAAAGGAALAMPWVRRAHAATPIDVFGGAGQSNYVGFPEAQDALDYSPIPPAGTSFAIDALGAIVPCVDPVYPTTTGSAWPMFCRTYNALTGRRVCIVGTGVGGSGQSIVQIPDNVNGVWDVSYGSSHTPTSIATIQAALVTLTGAGYTPTFRGMLWCQGEADAAYIVVGLENVWDYISAFNAMRPVFLAALGGQFYVFQTGTNSGDVLANQSQYRAIRNAQVYCLNSDPNSHMVFTGAVDFPPAQSFALQQTPANLHFTQHGYNRMGYIGAVNIVGLGLI